MYQYSNTDFRGFEAVLRLQDFIDSLSGLAAFNKHKCSFCSCTKGDSVDLSCYCCYSNVILL